MVTRSRSLLAAVTSAVSVVALVGTPAASAYGPDQYGGPWNGAIYGYSPWVRGDYGLITDNKAQVSGWPLCVTALDEIGGGEAGTARCSTGGNNVTIEHPYCGCAERTAYVRNVDAYNGGGVTGPGTITYAEDWWD